MIASQAALSRAYRRGVVTWGYLGKTLGLLLILQSGKNRKAATQPRRDGLKTTSNDNPEPP
jgi:hypothetical protein